MKTKNVSLAIVAFALAIGSAFASFLAPEDVYVKAVMTTGLDPVCTNTHVQCDAQGTEFCKVSVDLRNGSTELVNSDATAATKRPYRGTACSFVLKNTSATIIETVLTGDDRPISIH